MDLSAAATTSPSLSSTSSSAYANSWFSGIVRGRGDRSGSAKMSDNSAAADVGGPVNRKKQFRGVMFKYGPKPIQVAFKTGDYKQQVVFIGGLTDGFLATEYLEPLAIALDKEKWSLVQFLLSSSYTGYGITSLKEDAMELDQLISYLINKEDSEGVVLLGHSTGCQDIVYYMRTNAPCSRAVRAAILQILLYSRKRSVRLTVLICGDPVWWWWGGCGSHGCDALVVFCVPNSGWRLSELSIGRGAGISSCWGGDLVDEDCFIAGVCSVFWLMVVVVGPQALTTLVVSVVGWFPPPVFTFGRGRLGLTARLGSGGLYGSGCRCT